MFDAHQRSHGLLREARLVEGRVVHVCETLDSAHGVLGHAGLHQASGVRDHAPGMGQLPHRMSGDAPFRPARSGGLESADVRCVHVQRGQGLRHGGLRVGQTGPTRGRQRRQVVVGGSPLVRQGVGLLVHLDRVRVHEGPRSHGAGGLGVHLDVDARNVGGVLAAQHDQVAAVQQVRLDLPMVLVMLMASGASSVRAVLLWGQACIALATAVAVIHDRGLVSGCGDTAVDSLEGSTQISGVGLRRRERGATRRRSTCRRANTEIKLTSSTF